MSTAPTNMPQNTIQYNYADDTYFLSTAKNHTENFTNIQTAANQYIQFCNHYKLQIQPAKTNRTFFTRKRGTPRTLYPQCTIGNTHIARSTQTKILGFTLDTQPTLRPHIQNINTSTHKTIHALRKLFSQHRFISAYVGVILYKTLIRPTLTYVAPILIIANPNSMRPIHVTLTPRP